MGGEEGLVHYLFFIASELDGHLVPEFVWLKISEGETRSETLTLVDHADLFGDGQDEVVAVLGYYENYRYRIYRRIKNGNQWEQIFETEVLGCL
jgi:hypothetical protein